MRLLFFNPENDLALASGDAHYTPPASARQMAADMEDFPLLWAHEGDVVWRRDGSVADVQGRMIWPSLALAAGAVTEVLPWGWSPLLVQQLRAAGLPGQLLPTEAQMEAYRAWSSRRTAVELLSRLQAGWLEAFGDGRLVGRSAWCPTEAEVLRAQDAFGDCMLKAPWSGSGRGLRRVVAQGPDAADLAWVRRTMLRQGGVEVEPYYDKVADLAMEFWACKGHVRYEGLSLFHTTTGGVYDGNVVAAEAVKEARLGELLPVGLLHEVVLRLTALLSSAGLPSWYVGPLGVDMMVVSPSPGQPLALHPCVEVNLRMTMGWVALRLADGMPEGHVRRFRIDRSGDAYQAVVEEA